MKFESKMKLSYSDYIKGVNKDKASESDIEKWTGQVKTLYENPTNINGLMNTFGIPDQYSKSIKQRKYCVNLTSYTINHKKCILEMEFELIIEG